MLPSDGGSSGGSGGLWGAVTGFAEEAVGDLVNELSSFTTFQRRVDELIRELKESPASPSRVGEERVVRTQFGGGAGGWAEASNLFLSYEAVIGELEKLSKLLSESIEGVGIAVMASHNGYENIDADIRQRMLAISAGATDHYGGSYDPGLPRKSGADPASSVPAPEASGGTI